jgi:uroporphyrinogen-III decarboxylase
MRHQAVDHVPCAFMSFSAMRGRCQDPYEAAQREIEMGLDGWLFVPSSWRNERRNHPDLRGLPVRLPANVRTDLWIEQPSGEPLPILHKEYHTPAGTLTTRVRKSLDWPHGNFVPLMEDYQVPRAIKPLITTHADLDVLRTILQPPAPDEIAAFHAEMEHARAFSHAHGALLAGGWGVGVDMAAWLCGLENLIWLAADQPDLLGDLLATIETWNRARMKVILEAGMDLFIRRAWYEGSDFWSPRMYQHIILPIVQREAALAHEHDTLFGYTMTTGALPMLDHIVDSGIDVLIGADPLQSGENPLESMRDRLAGKMCIWGGVNGAITVEEGTEDDVRRAVTHALDVMHDANGFILSPVDNITEITRQTWRNVDTFIETWRRYRTK